MSKPIEKNENKTLLNEIKKFFLYPLLDKKFRIILTIIFLVSIVYLIAFLTTATESTITDIFTKALLDFSKMAMYILIISYLVAVVIYELIKSHLKSK